MKHKRRKENGHTLIEAMMILALIMMVFSQATPFFTSQASQQRTKDAALSVYSILKLFRSQAVTSLKTVECSLDVSDTLKGEVKLDIDNDSILETIASGEIQLINSLTELDFGDTTVVFNQYGYLESGPSSLTFCATKSKVKEPNHIISLSKPNFLSYGPTNAGC